jgi:F0F1-type ATP synthase membrane subunit b/b'
MEAMRQNWTDDRMDDLAEQVDTGFAQARVDIGSMRSELHREIKEQGRELREEMKTQAGELREEMKGLGREIREEMKTQASELREEMQGLGRELREEMKTQASELRGEVQDLRVQMDARFDALHAILAANQRTMLQICGGLCVALIAAVATLISAVI